MCTVTIIPIDDGSGPALRIGCNRDEARQRALALPPQVRQFEQRSAIMPLDPASGGTWIAVNDAGLAMVLLNRNVDSPGPPATADRPSRGTIIPSLLHCQDLHHARRLAGVLCEQPFAPFRLILTDRTALVEISAVRGKRQVVEWPRPDAPLLFTSSGLGDDLVDGARRQLFQKWFPRSSKLDDEARRLAEKSWLENQDGFHRHSWPDRQHLSVCMRRADARTVSYTVLDLRQHAAGMRYYPQAPDESGPWMSLGLMFRPPEVV